MHSLEPRVTKSKCAQRRLEKGQGFPVQDETDGLLQLISDIRGVSLQAGTVMCGAWGASWKPNIPRFVSLSQAFHMPFTFRTFPGCNEVAARKAIDKAHPPQADPAALNEVRAFLLEHEAGSSRKCLGGLVISHRSPTDTQNTKPQNAFTQSTDQL